MCVARLLATQCTAALHRVPYRHTPRRNFSERTYRDGPGGCLDHRGTVTVPSDDGSDPMIIAGISDD
eukprot:300343-Hanusia_phi.AAC.1